MKILIMAMAELGYGETIIGISLAKKLRRGGHFCYFVICAEHDKILSSEGFEYYTIPHRMGYKAQYRIDEIIVRIKPDVIILADYFVWYAIFCHNYSIRDTWFILKYDIPVLPIDIWSLEEIGYEIDCLSRRNPIWDKMKDMPVYLRPVPFGRYKNIDSKVMLFTLDNLVEYQEHKKDEARESIGIGKKEKVVLMAIGNGWQVNHPNNPHSTHINDLLFDGMPEFLSKQMSFLPEDTKIIYVGNRILGLEKYLYGRICNMPSCGIDCFNNMLYACDVFLTMNMSSTTLAKAIYAGIPSVVLTNPYEMCGPDDVDSVFAALGVGEGYEYQWARKYTPLSKFRIAPVGLYYVMEKLMQDNRYFKAMVEINMFDRNKVLTTIKRLLSQDKGDSELMQQRNRYFAEISAEQPNGFIDRFNQLMRQIV